RCISSASDHAGCHLEPMSKRKARPKVKPAVSTSTRPVTPVTSSVVGAARRQSLDWTSRLLPLLLIGAGLAAFYTSFNGVFLLDDIGRVVQNPQIRSLWPLSDVIAQSRRPVVEISTAINFALGGLNVRGYHVFNVAVHLAAGLVLFGILRRTL